MHTSSLSRVQFEENRTKSIALYKRISVNTQSSSSPLNHYFPTQELHQDEVAAADDDDDDNEDPSCLKRLYLAFLPRASMNIAPSK